MIAFFRRTLASKLALGLLALVLLAFILTGVFTHEMPGASSLGGGESGDVAARIGDRRIGTAELDERIRREYARYAQQQPDLDITRFVATGGFDAVVEQMIAGTALEAFGRQIGLRASDRQIDGEIASVPAFQGVNGKFDPATYRAALQQQRIAEPALRRDIAGDIVRRMLFIPASGATKLPDGLIRPYAALLVEERQGTIGFVPSTAFAGGAAPSDADLRGYYAAHPAAYALPERRVLRYALVGRPQVAAASAPSEAEIRKVYDANAAKYGARETRTLSQVVLDSQAKADAFAAQVKSGTGFAQAAAAAGFGAADIAIGDKTQAQFAEQTAPAVAQAAFAAAPGAVVGPIKTDFGWHVVKVEKASRTAATSFDAARPQIAADLVKQKQDAALGALVAKLQDGADNGRSFADIAQANGLQTVETPALTAVGAAPDRPGYAPAPEVQALLKPGFAGSSDQPPTVETLQPNERYALLSVGRVIPAAPIPFAQVRDRVAQDFAAQRAMDRAKAVATALSAKVTAGTDMAAAFKTAPVTLPAPQSGSGRRIDLAQAQVQVPASLRALFGMPVGTVKLVPAENARGWYVVQLRAIKPAADAIVAPLVAGTRGTILQATGDEYVAQLARAAGQAVGVRRNDRALLDLRNRLASGGAAGAQ